MNMRASGTLGGKLTAHIALQASEMEHGKCKLFSLSLKIPATEIEG